MKTNHQLGLMALIKRSRPVNLITGPIIYSIKKFSRKDFIIFDRLELKRISR